MFDYETLRILWWLILGVLLIGFAVTGGFDLGVGALYRFLGRDDDERRVLLESIEPAWEGNQVWFILGGGAAFAAWPLLYATSFSGLYLAMFLVLVALILRPVGFNFRGKLTDARWRNTWDWVLFVGGAAPALLFGVAFGNLFLGIPFHFDDLQRPIHDGGFFRLLHPFALLIGVMSLSMLLMHGATWAALKADEPMASRARRAGQGLAIIFMVVFVVGGLWLTTLPGHRIVGEALVSAPSNPLLKSVSVTPGAWLENFYLHRAFWLAPIITLIAAVLTWVFLSSRFSIGAFLASAVVQAGTILTGGFALFPFLLPSSSMPGHGLTIWDASSSAKTLLIMIIVVAIFLPIVLAYTTWVFRVLRGRVTLAEIRKHGGIY